MLDSGLLCWQDGLWRGAALKAPRPLRLKKPLSSSIRKRSEKRARDGVGVWEHGSMADGREE